MGYVGKVEEQILEATWPKTELHCTMQYDEKQKKLKEEKWAKEAGETQEIYSEVIVVGPEGAALQVSKNEWVKGWLRVEEAETQRLRHQKTSRSKT